MGQGRIKEMNKLRKENAIYKEQIKHLYNIMKFNTTLQNDNKFQEELHDFELIYQTAYYLINGNKIKYVDIDPGAEKNQDKYFIFNQTQEYLTQQTQNLHYQFLRQCFAINEIELKEDETAKLKTEKNEGYTWIYFDNHLIGKYKIFITKLGEFKLDRQIFKEYLEANKENQNDN